MREFGAGGPEEQRDAEFVLALNAVYAVVVIHRNVPKLELLNIISYNIFKVCLVIKAAVLLYLKRFLFYHLMHWRLIVCSTQINTLVPITKICSTEKVLLRF